MILHCTDTTSPPFTDHEYRLTFGDEVEIAIDAYYDGTYGGDNIVPQQALTSGAAFLYPYTDYVGGAAWVRGDMNCDGLVNSFDLDAFILALTNSAAYKAQYGRDPILLGDLNDDWLLNSLDIDPFVALLAVGKRDPVPLHLIVTGVSLSARVGETRIVATVDCDGQSAIDPENEADAVRVTVWDGSDMPPNGGLGAPPEWGAGIAISPFSTLNLRNGNVLTTIPLASWDPVGPPVGFTLYHNSLESDPDTAFNLPGGWSVSYGSRIDGSAGDATVAFVAADATRVVYTLSDPAGDSYAGPPGIHDMLFWDDENSQWILTSPNQWRVVYDSNGRITEIIDSAGNVSEIVYSGSQIAYVKSAADGLTGVGNNRLTFTYDGNDNLQKITDPIGREWIFTYSGDRLAQIHYPYDNHVPASSVQITYEDQDSDRVKDIKDRDAAASPEYDKTWSYTYTDGRLTKVQDPCFYAGGQYERHEQTFAYAAFTDGRYRTTHTDRRGHEWIYAFDGYGNLRELENPLEGVTSATYDSDHNVLTTTDELGHTWTYTYGPCSTLETVSSPLTGADAQTWTYTWLAPGPSESTNFYRLQRVEEPDGNWVEYAYEDENDPTLVTKITQEQAVDNGGDPEHTETFLHYYDTADPNANGQLALVIDANDVRHSFEYDKYGYFRQFLEGLASERHVAGAPDTNPVEPSAVGATGPLGWPGAGTCGRGCCKRVGYDANGNRLSCLWECPMLLRSFPTRLGNTPSPQCGTKDECFGSMEYNVVGRLQHFETCFLAEDGGFRNGDLTYDDLGLLTSITTETGSENTGWQVDRTWTINSRDADGRVLSATGPDGQTITYTVSGQPGYDELGREVTVTRGDMTATYTYDDASRVTRIDYGNGTAVTYEYDAANRVTRIDHLDDQDAQLLRIDYTWNTDNTVATRTETDSVNNETAVVTFDYDNRNRLIAETRIVDGTTVVYDFSYTYDHLGNRLEKINAIAGGRKTLYYYDSDPANRPAGFETNNNRLLWYEEYQPDGLGGWEQDPIRTVRYVYYITGHVANITVKDEYDGVGTPADFDWHYDLALYYTDAGLLWRVLWDRWTLDAQGGIDGYERLAGREFYYDGLGERFLTRDLDVTHAAPEWWTPVNPWDWTDTVGLDPWADFGATITEPPSGPWTATTFELRRYLPGVAEQDLGPPSEPIVYRHGDLLDSTMLLTDETASATATLAYSAFGEPVGDAAALPTRYQFAGGHGYESGLLTLPGAPGTVPLTFQHLGARWYQPNTARFIQRDPIGLAGGMNVYAYCANNPVGLVDPEGQIHPAVAGIASGLVMIDGPLLPIGDAVAGVVLVCAFAYEYASYAEHTKNKRKSTKGRHDDGVRRAKQKHNNKARNHPTWQPRGNKKNRIIGPGPIIIDVPPPTWPGEEHRLWA